MNERTQINETQAIEELNGKFYPMYKNTIGGWSYFKVSANKTRSFASEKNARAFLASK